METPKTNPYFIIFAGVLAVSTSAIFVKLAEAPAGVTAFYRLAFSVLIMLPVFLTNYVKELRHITKSDWWFSILAGVFLAFHFILWFESLNYTSVASSTVLVTMQPLFAFIGAALFFKEKITVAMIGSGVLAIFGSVLISWGDFQISGLALVGDLLALVACALVTVYLFVGQSLRKRLSLMTYTFIVYLASTFSLLIYVVAVGEPLLPYEPIQWGYFLLLALIPNLLGHTLFNWSVKWISTTVISIAILVEPLGATVLAYYILDESLIVSQMIGGTIVLLGIGLFLLSQKRNYKKILKVKHTKSG